MSHYEENLWQLVNATVNRYDYLPGDTTTSANLDHFHSIFLHAFKHGRVHPESQQHVLFSPRRRRPPLHPFASCGPSMCWPADPGGSSLLFRIIANRPAWGMEDWHCGANATLLLQLLLAATATGAENQTYRFVIISRGSRFPTCLSTHFLFSVLCVLRSSLEDGVSQV